MFCGTCGTQAMRGATYCLMCGTKISQPLVGELASPGPVADGTVVNVTPPAYPGARPVAPISAYPPGYGPPPRHAPAPSYTAMPDYVISSAMPGGVNVVASPALAPWWKRFVAMIIDCCVLGAGYFILLIIVGIIVKGAQNGTTTTTNQTDSAQVAFGIFIVFIVASLPNCLYFGIMNGSKRGQTLGKMALGIAVRDARSGREIGFWRSVGRSVMVVVFEIALFVPFIVDSLSPLWDKKRQAWHDKVVHSVVIDLRP